MTDALDTQVFEKLRKRLAELDSDSAMLKMKVVNFEKLTSSPVP